MQMRKMYTVFMYTKKHVYLSTSTPLATMEQHKYPIIYMFIHL
jgi:hypothetical protein